MRLNQKGSGEFLGIVVIALATWGIINFFHHPNYSKPWWNGSEYQQVCLIGSDGGCYSLLADSDGTTVTTVHFTNGGYIYPSGEVTCDQDKEIGRWCDFQDSQGRNWEVRENIN